MAMMSEKKQLCMTMVSKFIPRGRKKSLNNQKGHFTYWFRSDGILLMRITKECLKSRWYLSVFSFKLKNAIGI
jgi:hypothetical protein